MIHSLWLEAAGLGAGGGGIDGNLFPTRQNWARRKGIRMEIMQFVWFSFTCKIRAPHHHHHFEPSRVSHSQETDGGSRHCPRCPGLQALPRAAQGFRHCPRCPGLQGLRVQGQQQQGRPAVSTWRGKLMVLRKKSVLFLIFISFILQTRL